MSTTSQRFVHVHEDLLAAFSEEREERNGDNLWSKYIDFELLSEQAQWCLIWIQHGLSNSNIVDEDIKSLSAEDFLNLGGGRLIYQQQ